MTGVREIIGGAGLGGMTLSGVGRSEPDLLEVLELENCIDGLRGSTVDVPCMVRAFSTGSTDAAAVADANGEANVFLTLEKSDETNAYEDWSCSSSSENGLNDVRLVTSSNLLLLRDREDAALPNG